MYSANSNSLGTPEITAIQLRTHAHYQSPCQLRHKSKSQAKTNFRTSIYWHPRSAQSGVGRSSRLRVCTGFGGFYSDQGDYLGNVNWSN
ncbi:hypothetical protein Trydic_g16067 [Trypoxylus dichotomus]